MAKITMMWQVREADGTPLSFLTVQEDIARKLCDAQEGRTMELIAVSH